MEKFSFEEGFFGQLNNFTFPKQTEQKVISTKIKARNQKANEQIKLKFWKCFYDFAGIEEKYFKIFYMFEKKEQIFKLMI